MPSDVTPPIISRGASKNKTNRLASIYQVLKIKHYIISPTSAVRAILTVNHKYTILSQLY